MQTTNDGYLYFKANSNLTIYKEETTKNDPISLLSMRMRQDSMNWFVNGDVFLAKINEANTLSMEFNSDDTIVNIKYDPKNIQIVKLPQFSNFFYIHQDETIQSKPEQLINLIANITNIELEICSIIIEYIPFYIPLFESYCCWNNTQNTSDSKRHFTVPYFQFKEQFIDYITKCHYAMMYGIHSVSSSVFDGIKCIKDIDLSNRNNFSMPIIDIITCDESDLRLIPKWLKQIFWSFKYRNKQYEIFYKLDLYITNDKYDKNKINEETFEYDKKSLQLIATKYDISLESLININEGGGSEWFEVTFNDNIYLNDCKSINIRVGGNNDASKSRHWFQIHCQNNLDRFINVLPILSISMALSIGLTI
eukprot:186998_1